MCITRTCRDDAHTSSASPGLHHRRETPSGDARTPASSLHLPRAASACRRHKALGNQSSDPAPDSVKAPCGIPASDAVRAITDEMISGRAARVHTLPGDVCTVHELDTVTNPRWRTLIPVAQVFRRASRTPFPRSTRSRLACPPGPSRKDRIPVQSTRIRSAIPAFSSLNAHAPPWQARSPCPALPKPSPSHRAPRPCPPSSSW